MLPVKKLKLNGSIPLLFHNSKILSYDGRVWYQIDCMNLRNLLVRLSNGIDEF